MEERQHFVIIGAMKAGTTWADSALREASNAFMPKGVKELHFLDELWDRGVPWYQSHWGGSPAQGPLGEVSSSYYACPEAAQRLHSIAKNSRVVVILRDPGARSWSHYLHLIRKGSVAPGTEFRVAAREFPEIVEWSRYRTLLEPWLETFGERLTALKFEEIHTSSRMFAQHLSEAVGVEIDVSALPDGAQNEARAPRSYMVSKFAASTSARLHSAGLHQLVELAKRAGASQLVERRSERADTSVRDAARLLVWDQVGADAVAGAERLGVSVHDWLRPREEGGA